MRDVAQAVGVSQSTVSRILSPFPSTANVPISDKTKERVLAIVEELGYRLNQYARSLKGMKTLRSDPSAVRVPLSGQRVEWIGYTALCSFFFQSMSRAMPWVKLQG